MGQVLHRGATDVSSGPVTGNTEVWGELAAEKQPRILRRSAPQDDSA